MYIVDVPLLLFPMLPPSFYCRKQVQSLVLSTMMMGLWFILLVPFVILMTVIGNQRKNEGEDEEVGSGTYHGEEEVEEEEEENQIGPHTLVEICHKLGRRQRGWNHQICLPPL